MWTFSKTVLSHNRDSILKDGHNPHILSDMYYVPMPNMIPPRLFGSWYEEFDHNAMTRFKEMIAQNPHDVYFFGALNPHRKQIETQCNSLGVRLKFVGFWRNSLANIAHIKFSKFQFCVHCYWPAVLEIHRVHQLMVMGECVVAERGRKSQHESLMER
jgi:hypothetical protein